MSPTPEPRAGHYQDSCGTRYTALKHPKTGWWLHKQSTTGNELPPAYPKPDFPASVNAGIFTYYSPQSNG